MSAIVRLIPWIGKLLILLLQLRLTILKRLHERSYGVKKIYCECSKYLLTLSEIHN